MSSPGRPSSHRASTPAGEVARRLVPPLVAVAAVVAVVLVLLALNSRPNGGPGPALVPPSPALTSTTPAATTSSVPATAAARVTATARPTRTPPVQEPSATPVPSSHAAAPAVQRPAVTVLNNSRRSGLAAHVADELTSAGWPVAQVGNFTGRIAMTTVYYAAGQQAAAHSLAARFSAIRRVEPRFAGLPGHGLTLVVTRDWPT